jgi:Icc-related predicted phosphoesterase
VKLLIFSDIHADYSALEHLVETDADFYFAAGDLVNWNRSLDRVGPILARRSQKMYVLPGNHESEESIAQLCHDFHLHNFHGASLSLDGYHVAGLGYSNPTPFDTPGEYSESDIAARLEPFAALSPLILICHCPPQGTPLDRVPAGTHFGSTAVREFIEKYQPAYFFCGHVHEAAGSETLIGKTRARNVGKKGYLLDLA